MHSAETATVKESISPNLSLSKLLRSYPEALDVLTKYGLLHESLQDAAKSKSMPDAPFKKLLSELEEFSKPIKVTPLAREKILEIMKEEKKEGHALRVRAVPGGMGGVQYEFAFEKKAEKDDTTLDLGELKLFIDSISMNVMEGSKIDYVEGAHGAGFKVDNPNASAGGGGGGCCSSGGGSSGGGGGGGCGCG